MGVNLPDIALLKAHTISAPFNAAAPGTREKGGAMTPVKNLASAGYARAREFCVSLFAAFGKRSGIMSNIKKSGGLDFSRPPDGLLIWFVFCTAWPLFE
jgi:hypothetical protein